MLSGELKVTRTVKKKQQKVLATKQFCTCSTLFFVHFVAVVLQDYNVKLRETSYLGPVYMEVGDLR